MSLHLISCNQTTICTLTNSHSFIVISIRAYRVETQKACIEHLEQQPHLTFQSTLECH
uniref:Uncharacterized protein n=1 Tax=Anguilla anguilla TaxID=7936 RepID=A0A0E9S7I3_ANGAN